MYVDGIAMYWSLILSLHKVCLKMENEVMHIKLKFKEIQINDIDSVITDDRWIKK